MSNEKRKYKCEGCGSNRPCFAETNQEPSTISIHIEDLKCILDETNQSYFWVEVTDTRTSLKDELIEKIK